MQVGVLGPLAVQVGEVAVPVAGSRLRSLLLRLAVEPSRPVSISELAAAVWRDDLPSDPANALQSLVSRLRRVLGRPGLISQQPTGYQLELDPACLDATRFTQLVAAGRAMVRAGRLPEAGTTLAEALSLWRGPALVDAGDADYAAGYATRWDDLRLRARSDLIEVALGQGRAADVVGELEELVTAYPFRETFVGQLMRALAGSGRAAEALRRYEQTRQLLADQLGSDPGSDLQALHLSLLRGEAPGLIGPGGPGSPGPVAGAAPVAAGDEAVAPLDEATAHRRRRTNLRASVTTFVGRSQDLDRVSGLLSSSRLTTIVGPGGAGKTRLAVEAARLWLAEHREAAWLVELAPVTSEANIAPTMMGALGVRDVRLLDRPDLGRQSDSERLFDALADSACLLVIDNCEHLIEPVSRLVDDILGRAPAVRILTTSREPLTIAGEALCPIPPLRQPAIGADLQTAVEAPAVRLWVDRAQAVKPGFALTDDNVATVTEIVRRLDGLPLAIELAAARLRVLPLGEIAGRLSDRFRLLTGGNRTALPRHRTLRAVVEWSWDLLSADERLLAERLSVFPAGASPESAVAVCADERLRPELVEELLTSLVDKSLLEATDSTPVRYRMLETIREYGVERLTERGEIHAVRTAHADHFARLAAALEPPLHEAGQLDALAQLNTERDNIIAALRYYGDSGRAADALVLGLSLVWYWTLRGRNTEVLAWMTFVLDANTGRRDPMLVYAEAARAISRVTSADAGRDWQQLQDEFADILRRLDLAGEPPFVSLLAMVPLLGMFANGMENATEVLSAGTRSPHRWVRAVTHAWLASAGENNGDLEQIRRETGMAYAEFAAIGDRWGLSTVLTARAHLATLEGDLDAAVADTHEALRYVTELGSTEDDLYLLLRLAGLHLRRGDIASARGRLQELRARSADVPMAAEREVFADLLLSFVLRIEGRLDEALALSSELRRRVMDDARPSPMQGHALSLVLATAAVLAADAGQLGQALDDVTTAYPVGVLTRDMPVIATVGVSVSHVAAALSRWTDAAEMLGAAAQVRGGDDETDPLVAELRGRLAAALGETLEPTYRRGRALSREEAIKRLDPAQLTTPQGG